MRQRGAATRRLRPRPDLSPGVATFFFGALRPFRTSCEVVGMRRTMLATKIARPMTAEPIFSSASAGVFEPTGHARGPWDPDALHGGAPAALLVRAVSDLDTGLGLGRLTIDYLGPVPLAPLTVAAEVVRPGRRFAVVEATIDADGRRCCFARAVLVRRGPVELADHWEPEPPTPLAAPEEGWSSPFPVEGSAGAEDAFHRSVFDIELFLFINPDLSIQVLRPPRGEWIGLAARTELSDDGTGVARSTLHDRDGPVGSAAQTLFVAAR